jgi:glycosyltransferase involved in cell wall biosynthesis
VSRPIADPGTRGRRVWMVNHHAGAPDESAGTRHYALARQLVRRGHEVTIFAGNVSGHPGKRNRLKPGQLCRAERHEGVRFVWIRTIPYRDNGGWRRPAGMLAFLAAFVVVQSRESRPDLIIGSTVHPFAALGGWMAAKLRGARFAFEIRDLWPQTMVDLGAMRVGSPGERMLRALEAFLVRRASAVITLLPGIRAYLLERGLPADHVVYIPNGADLDAFSADASLDNAPGEVTRLTEEIARLRAEGRFVVGYLGAFGRVNRADLIAGAGVLCERRDPGRLGVVIVGEGPERPAVEQAADGSPSVSICHAIPKAFVPTILRSLDAAVVHTTYTPVYRYGVSFNKLFEYMAAERPVVFACDSAYDPVRQSGAGITIAPDSAEALAEAFLELASTSPEARSAMGAAGLAHVEREHSMETLGETLAALVEDRLPAERS